MELDEKASEYVLDLMNQTEEKLLYLVEFLKDRDKAELLRRIEEVEVSPDQAKENIELYFLKNVFDYCFIRINRRECM